MHDELFKKPAIVSRYRTGPYAEGREHFLKQACAEGYSRSTLERIAWVLLIVAEAVQRNGGRISVDRLEKLSRSIPLGNGRRPSGHTASLLRRFGEDWLRSIGALLTEPDQPSRFARELSEFAAACAASSVTPRSRAGAVLASRSASICRVSTHSTTFPRHRPSTR